MNEMPLAQPDEAACPPPLPGPTWPYLIHAMQVYWMGKDKGCVGEGEGRHAPPRPPPRGSFLTLPQPPPLPWAAHRLALWHED